MEYYNQKISLNHLKRKAILYIRQSSMKQVFENKESTFRQYALKEKLVTTQVLYAVSTALIINDSKIEL